MNGADAKKRARTQFAASGDAYVVSTTHAGGSDLDRLIEVVAPEPEERALDIATGGGHVALALAPRMREVVASDLTPEMLATAERFLTARGVGNARFALADAEALPFAGGAFDIVTCRIAPHHFPRPERFVAEVARVLAPGGRFGMVDSTVPVGPLGAIYNAFERARDGSHVRSLTVAEWSEQIVGAGLRLVLVEHFTKRHDFAAWCDRARVADAERPALVALLASAGEAGRSTFGLEFADDRLVAFSDTKSLFLAVKADAAQTIEGTGVRGG